MAHTEEYIWLIGLVQGRHEALGLSFEQAERVYQFEATRDIYSEKHYFTPWEEWDFELSSFREILDPRQLSIYEANLRAVIQQYELSLAEQDKEKGTEIAFHEATIRYYETQFLPDLLQPRVPMFVGLHHDSAKVDYLRKVYHDILQEAKKELLVSHFRYSRSFRPRELQAGLLRHKLWSLLPDYNMFSHRMDAPTKAVAEFVEQKVVIMLDESKQLIKQKFAELKAFSEANFKQHYGDARGWHVVRMETDEATEMMHCAMSVLLLEGSL